MHGLPVKYRKQMVYLKTDTKKLTALNIVWIVFPTYQAID